MDTLYLFDNIFYFNHKYQWNCFIKIQDKELKHLYIQTLI